MTRVSIKTLLIAALCAAATLSAQSAESLFDVFSPDTGWQSVGSPTTFGPADIEKFGPAIAPTLERYGIQGIAVQDWTGRAGPAHVTVYQMTDSAAAYGLFSIKRNADLPGYAAFPFGAEGFRVEGHAAFWKGPYMIELEGDTKAIEDWARIAASGITGSSLKPPVSSYLPSENRAEGSDRYMVSASTVEGDWGFDPIRLGFENSAEAATATYVLNGKRVQLLLVMYPTQQMAKKYEEELTTVSGDSLRFKKRAGPLVAIIEPGAEPVAAEALLGEIRHEFQVTWNEPRPGPNVAVVILTIFKFIGIALVVTLVAGVVFGVVRILVKRWFPGQVFDRPQDNEVIQLKLNQLLKGRVGPPPESPPRRLSQ